jgi:hypothetical protein
MAEATLAVVPLEDDVAAGGREVLMGECFDVDTILEKLRKDRAELAFALEEARGWIRRAVGILESVQIGSGRFEVVEIVRTAKAVLKGEGM